MSVTHTDDLVLNRPEAATEAQRSAIRSRLLKALVFEILAALVSTFGAFMMVGATIGIATEDRFTGVTLYFGYLADGLPAAFLIASAALSVVLVVRTWRMLAAANRDDLATLHKLNSLGWVAIAYVFSWIVPGHHLLKANRLIREAVA